MESAIDPKLLCPRSLNRRVPDDYVPAAPAYGHRSDAGVEEVVMMFAGVQFERDEQHPQAWAATRRLVTMLTDGPDGAMHHDLTFYRDGEGFSHFMVAGYWLDGKAYQRWSAGEVVRW